MKTIWIKVSTMIYTIYMVARYGLDDAEKIINRKMLAEKKKHMKGEL